MELLLAYPHLTLVEVAAQIGKSVSASERASAKLTSEGRPCRVGPVKAASGKYWNDQTRSSGTPRGDRTGDSANAGEESVKQGATWTPWTSLQMTDWRHCSGP